MELYQQFLPLTVFDRYWRHKMVETDDFRVCRSPRERALLRRILVHTDYASIVICPECTLAFFKPLDFTTTVTPLGEPCDHCQQHRTPPNRDAQLIADVLAEYPDELDKAACGRCTDCGMFVMCRFHSLISMLMQRSSPDAEWQRWKATEQSKVWHCGSCDVWYVADVATCTTCGTPRGLLR